MTIMRGLPGSGKTTRAQKIMKDTGNTFRVNRDSIREMLHFNSWTPKNEKLTIEAEKLVAAAILKSDYNLIVDDTNLTVGHVDMWKAIAKDYGARVEIIDMMKEVPVSMCIARDAQRERPIGRAIIMDMALRVGIVNLGNVVLCDIDGTIADPTHRLEHVKKEKKDWKTFFSLMHLDAPRQDVWNRVINSAENNEAYIILISARPERYRKVTEDWLIEHKMTEFVHLLMRPTTDHREDTLVKSDMCDRFLHSANIVEIFDDRPSVIRMWRERGFNVTDVGQGYEF